MDLSNLTLEQLAGLQEQLKQEIEKKAAVRPLEKVAKNRTQVVEIEKLKINPYLEQRLLKDKEQMEIVEKLAEEYVKLGMNTQPVVVEEYLSSYKVQEFKSSIVIYLASKMASRIYPPHTKILVVVLEPDNQEVNDCIENEALLLEAIGQ